jgi:hypothetical protein
MEKKNGSSERAVCRDRLGETRAGEGDYHPETVRRDNKKGKRVSADAAGAEGVGTDPVKRRRHVKREICIGVEEAGEI